MEPLLILIKDKQPLTDESGYINPGDDLTSIDRVNKSTLLSNDIFLARSTKETKVRHETTDDE